MKRKKRKQRVNSKKVVQDGITFASGLEKYTYLALKKAKLFEHYEGEKFTIVEGFTFSNESYERQSNGKGELRDRGSKKVLGISYTPDFTGRDYIIECKGRANDTFPIRWKLFKKWCHDNGEERTLYKPQNQKEVDEIIEIIKKKRNGQI